MTIYPKLIEAAAARETEKAIELLNRGVNLTVFDTALYLTIHNGHQKTWGLLHNYTAVVSKSTGGQYYEN